MNEENEISAPVTGKTVYQATEEEIYAMLGSSPDGLSEENVAEKLSKFGKNVLPQKKGKPVILVFLSNFVSLMQPSKASSLLPSSATLLTGT